MSFRRLFSREDAGALVTEQMMQAYLDNGSNRSKLFTKFVTTDKDLESISREMMKAA